MPEKPKTRNWKDPKTVIAALSITALLGLWNAFATQDRRSDGTGNWLASTASALPEATSDEVCFTPIQMDKLGKKCPTVTHTRSS